MSGYQGLDAALRQRVRARDGPTCRWCGRTDQHTELHHIRYRRSVEDDVLENLISLDRLCHSFVHGILSTHDGQFIQKQEAQAILSELTRSPGMTGLSLWRQSKSERTSKLRPLRG